jgi:molybdate transport system substrate-binding protein
MRFSTSYAKPLAIFRNVMGWPFAGSLWLMLMLSASPVLAENLMVFAAASLTDAIDTVAADFQRSTGEKVTVSFASSSTLARQIEQGAPAHIFISATPDWMDYLQERGYVQPGSQFNLLKNRLVLIAPQTSQVTLKIAPNFPLAAVLGDERLAMADPDHVPAGIYARTALENLEVWTDVASQAARVDTVRIALALVARGEAPLGIVYQSDTVVEPQVRIVDTFPRSSHPPIVYPVARIAESDHPAADKWLAFLRSDAASAVFERYGFTVIK